MKFLDKYNRICDQCEIRVAAWMAHHGYTLLRVSMGIVFIWFGALKPLGLSPAEELVARTTLWVPAPGLLHLLGAWEMAIGVCFLFKPLAGWAVALLLPQMLVAMSPLVLLPELSYVQFPFGLTLEGQYLIKNLVLLAAAFVLGGRIQHRMRGATSRAPDAFHTILRRGRWGVAHAGARLANEGEEMSEVFFIRDGGAVVRVGGRQVGVLKTDQFIGEMSFLTDGKTSATVEITEPTHFVAWKKEELRTLLDRRQTLEHAMQATMNLDLVAKIRRTNRVEAQ
ncbi:MAG: cyclic nucleotide-binding domain-containing protein [Proteobacteria bacterium]|nr:cyclic nucleotide-binding domain-containing protein [Pseudomonadota bacterium]